MRQEPEVAAVEGERKRHWVGGEVQRASDLGDGGAEEAYQVCLKDSGGGQKQKEARVDCWNADEASRRMLVSHPVEGRTSSDAEVEETSVSQPLGTIEEPVRKAKAGLSQPADHVHAQQDTAQAWCLG
jgi:hypothetical protein